MAGNPRILVEFLAETGGLSKGFSQAEASTKTFGSSVKRLGRTAVVAGGAAGLAALTTTLAIGVKEFSEASKVSAQTDAVLKSTGKSAGVTAKQVDQMATALMNKSGVDDEAIKSGENLLLTFTNIQNQAGKNNDIFNQATRTMLDMSVALGQDATQSAVQLGKALQDPVRGITALRRVGVSFTEAQQAQIKAMVESGNVMGAQKLILAELNKEFGGSAEALGKTLPGQVNIARESFNNLAGTMVGILAPAFQKITSFLTEHPALFKAMVIGVLALSAAMVALNVVLAVTSVVASPIALVVLAVVAAFAALVAIGYVLYKLFGDLGLVILAIIAPWTALIVALILVVKHWNEIKQAVVTAMNAIKNAVLSGWAAITTAITTAVNAVRTAVTTAWSAMRTAVLTALTAMQTAVTTTWNAIRTVVTTVAAAIRTAAITTFNAIQTAVTAAVHATQAAVTTAWNLIRTVVTAAANAARTVVAALTAAFNTARSAVSALAGAIPGLSAVLHAVQSAASAAAGALRGPLAAAANVAKGALSGLSGILGGIAGALSAAAGAANALASAIRSIPSHINLPSIPHLPHIPGLSRGGIVTRPTLAMIGEAGPEAIIPLSAGGGVGGVAGADNIEVRVFIGSQELRGLVRSEIVQSDTSLARTLLAGARL